jgi:hypothetical protein
MDDQLSASTYTTHRSGTTIDGNAISTKAITATSGSTIPKVNYGQGVAYKLYRGETGVSGAGGPTNRLSNGTMVITTGLTAITAFSFGWLFKSGTTVIGTRQVVYGGNNGYHYGSGGTVTLFITNGGKGVTPGSSANTTGASVVWQAMGT